MTCRLIHQWTGEDGMTTCSSDLKVSGSYADVSGVFSSMPGLDDGEGC